MDTALLEPPSTQVKLQKLSPKHREVLSLVAQGVARGDIASICGYEPEYVTWLVRQDVCKQYLKDMLEVVDFRLQTMTVESVDAIADVLKEGTSEERLRAAKLQLEAVGRLGTGKQVQGASEGGLDQLTLLAGRLVSLLKDSREGRLGQVVDVEDVQVTYESQT